MIIKCLNFFLKELAYLNSNFEKCFLEYEYKIEHNKKFDKMDVLCEIIQTFAQTIEPDDTDDKYWKEKLILDKMIDGKIVIKENE